MPMNKVKTGSSMYQFLNDYPSPCANKGFTWNVIKGVCPHDCSYCYMKRFKQSPVRFDKKELKTDLGQNNLIFVGSSCDMWAEEIPASWIQQTIEHCIKAENRGNRFLFQSKNPARFTNWAHPYPMGTILGTTIESNIIYPQMGKAPAPVYRAEALSHAAEIYKTMVTIEPIMDFDLRPLAQFIKMCHPAWVNIGADSKGHGLPEPPGEKIKELIQELERFTEVKVKKNLKRIWGQYPSTEEAWHEIDN